jgi:hypothetical protein
LLLSNQYNKETGHSQTAVRPFELPELWPVVDYACGVMK